jgi:hypoxanthine phosphoribosyltransferase
MPTYSTLFSTADIARRVTAMGAEIRASYPPGPDGEPTPITLIGVLKGSFVFLADLARAIPGPVEIEFLGVSSYSGTESSGNVRITHDLRADIAGRHCLLVEDIADTGLTLDYIRRALDVRGPATLRVAAFLDKPSRRIVPVQLDFIGFSIPDHFVIGYGLDLDQRYRNLPEVAIVGRP